MQSRVDTWAKRGGKKDKLWNVVRHAEKREGVVVCADPGDADPEACKTKPREREIERLRAALDYVVKMREEIKKGMEVLVWRERLLELASERAAGVGQCGWDQRLCFGEEEWADFGQGVLESYEVKVDGVKEEGGEGEAEAEAEEGDGEWWCPGKKVCDRHSG